MFITLTFIGIPASLPLDVVLDVYAANEKRCISQRRMSKFADQKIFMSSTNVGHDFTQAFGVDLNAPTRHGFVSRVSVFLEHCSEKMETFLVNLLKR